MTPVTLGALVATMVGWTGAYAAGAGHSWGWMLGGAGIAAIACLINWAQDGLSTPGIQTPTLEWAQIKRYTQIEQVFDDDEMPVYVAASHPGLTRADAVFMARVDGRRVLIIEKGEL